MLRGERMEQIFFLNEEHKQNFKTVLLKWGTARNDAEYKSACYILAVPMIFDKVSQELSQFDAPIDWIYEWELKHTLSKMEEYQGDEDDGPQLNFDLTGSMVQLGKLSLNLWNGYEYFNLLDCVSSLDEHYYKVMKTAIDIRSKKT